MKHKFTEAQLKWLEDLESGRYQRGYAALDKVDGEGVHRYCCLGVACETFRVRVTEIIKSADGQDIVSHGYSNFGVPAKWYAPEEVVEKLGLHTEHGQMLAQKGWVHSINIPTNKLRAAGLSYEVSSLAQLNDNSNYTFKEIAAIIRENAQYIFRHAKI